MFRWNKRDNSKKYKGLESFNTTIVSVEHYGCKQFNRYCEVSIQLLFRWNETLLKAKNYKDMFQYNYCFGGTRKESFEEHTKLLVSIQLLFRWNLLNLGLFETNLP